MHRGSNFSTSWPTLVLFFFFFFFLFFYRCHPNECEMVSHCVSDLHFPNDYWWWASFHTLIGYLQIFFEETSTHVLCSNLIWVVWFLLLSLGVLYLFWILSPCQTHGLQIWSPILWVVLLLLIMSFEIQNFLISMKSSMCIFLFYWLLLGGHILEIITKSNLVKFCLMFSSKSIIVLALTFRSLIYWELSFVYGVR